MLRLMVKNVSALKWVTAENQEQITAQISQDKPKNQSSKIFNPEAAEGLPLHV